MPITDDRTFYRNWAKPSSDNELHDDLPRLRATFDAVDADVNEALARGTNAINAAAGASGSASAAESAAAAAQGTAQASARSVAISGSDTSPGLLADKIETDGLVVETIMGPGGNERLKISVRDASTTQIGVVRLATDGEGDTGSASDIAMTPRGVARAVQNSLRMRRSSRSANSPLAAADNGKFIDILSGTFTQTFASVTALGDSWYVWIRNNGNGDITLDPNGTEQIDGLGSYKMYPGEVRLVQCDATSLRSLVIQPFRKLWTANDTFVWPPGYQFVDAQGTGGAGGGAGAGTKLAGTTTNDVYGGGGGSGGAASPVRRIPAPLPGSVDPIVIGTGGTGGAGAAQNSGLVSGTNGANGTTTSFGSYLQAPGGNGGIAATSTGQLTGAAGPAAIPGVVSGEWAGGPGVPRNGATTMPVYGGGGGGTSGDFGGTTSPGGKSVFGGPGGGGGAGSDPTPPNWTQGTTQWNGQPGGAPWGVGSALSGGGAIGGTSNASSSGNGADGAPGSQGDLDLVGTGGGGGGSGGARGGDGGAGGRAAGGGGGGAGFTGRGGNGGNGGNGALRVVGVA